MMRLHATVFGSSTRCGVVSLMVLSTEPMEETQELWELWTYEEWPQGWILALYEDIIWWCDLDTPMYRLQSAHAHLVFTYRACLHEWSIWISSVFVQPNHRRKRYGTLLVHTVREWHQRLAIEGLIHSVTREEHEDLRQFWQSQKATLEPIQMGRFSDGSTKYVTGFIIRGC